LRSDTERHESPETKERKKRLGQKDRISAGTLMLKEDGRNTRATDSSRFLRLDDGAAVIMAARGAHMMREPWLAAIGAFNRIGRLQSMMRAAHIAHGFRGPLFRNGHFKLSRKTNNKARPDI
jgi:hypothetical protein